MKKCINGKWLTEEEALIEHDKMVRKICNSYRVNGFTPGVTKDDLYSAGCIGLMLAYREFDASKGNMFSTYAYKMIRGEILNTIYGSGGKGFTVTKNFMVLVGRLMREGEEDGDPAELSERYGYSERFVRRAQAFINNQTYSLDKQTDNGTDDNSTALDYICGTVDDTSRLESVEFMQLIPEVFHELLLYRLEGKTQNEIAELTGFSQVHISRLIAKVGEWQKLYTEDPARCKFEIKKYKNRRGITI